jgi:hypothetical protein
MGEWYATPPWQSPWINCSWTVSMKDTNMMISAKRYPPLSPVYPTFVLSIDYSIWESDLSYLDLAPYVKTCFASPMTPWVTLVQTSLMLTSEMTTTGRICTKISRMHISLPALSANGTRVALQSLKAHYIPCPFQRHMVTLFVWTLWGLCLRMKGSTVSSP